MKSFSPETIEQMGYYVYLYVHPETRKIFYVGKGKGNRAFSHLEDESESEKTRVINALRREDCEPEIEILAHGLNDEATALKIEAAAIELLGADNLTNKVRGHDSVEHGRISVELLDAKYAKKPVEIVHPVILIRINKLYRHDMTPVELYDATRQFWVVGPRREKAKYAFAVYQGVIREVYEIHSWHPGGTFFSTREDHEPGEISDNRYEFIGDIAPASIRRKYKFKSVDHYFTKHSQNPIAYVNVE